MLQANRIVYLIEELSTPRNSVHFVGSIEIASKPEALGVCYLTAEMGERWQPGEVVLLLPNTW